MNSKINDEISKMAEYRQLIAYIPDLKCGVLRF